MHLQKYYYHNYSVAWIAYFFYFYRIDHHVSTCTMYLPPGGVIDHFQYINLLKTVNAKCQRRITKTVKILWTSNMCSSQQAGTRAKQALSKFSCCIYSWCFVSSTSHKSSIYMMVSASYNVKFYLGHDDGLRRSRYFVSDTALPLLKAYRILNITQLSLCAAGLILLAGDICPQPGPTFQLNNSGLWFGPKSRGLALAHLNIRSLLHKMDEVNLVMGGAKSFDISSFLETWLKDMVTDDEILMPGYSRVRRDRQRKAGGEVAIYASASNYVWLSTWLPSEL